MCEVVPDGCAGLPNVPKPLLNACGANRPPPDFNIRVFFGYVQC